MVFTFVTVVVQLLFWLLWLRLRLRLLWFIVYVVTTHHSLLIALSHEAGLSIMLGATAPSVCLPASYELATEERTGSAGEFLL